MDSLELFSDETKGNESIESYDERVEKAVNALTLGEKKAVMIFTMSAAEYDHTKLLVRLCEHSPLLRASIHKTDMTSKEFHILEELLDDVCEFSRLINVGWENWIVRRLK